MISGCSSLVRYSLHSMALLHLIRKVKNLSREALSSALTLGQFTDAFNDFRVAWLSVFPVVGLLYRRHIISAIDHKFLWFMGWLTTGDVGRTREEFVNHEPQASDLRILRVVWRFVLFPDQFVRECKLAADRWVMYMANFVWLDCLPSPSKGFYIEDTL